MSQVLLDQIVQLRTQRKHEQAVVLLRQTLARLPEVAQLIASTSSTERDTNLQMRATMEYELACLCDYLGDEENAWPHYQNALTISSKTNGGLNAEQLRGALLGAGSTARNIKKMIDSESLLRQGFNKFGVDSEFAPFLALTLHSQGKTNEALALAINCISKTSANPNITQFNRALAEYTTLLCSPSHSAV